MRETPRELVTRGGAAYAPHSAGRGLGSDEACPTLHRWPGAGALHRALATRLTRLGPEESDTLWLSTDARGVAPGGAGRFGALVVLEPLRLGAAPVRAGVYAARNEDVDGDVAVWVPSDRLDADWDAVATVAQARALLGPGWGDARARAVDELAAYLEDLDGLRRAGARPPGVPWCELDGESRARILAEHGVRGRWG